MPKVPELKPFKSSVKTTAIYCFPKGVSEADKQHDIEQVNKFIDYIKAKKRKATESDKNTKRRANHTVPSELAKGVEGSNK